MLKILFYRCIFVILCENKQLKPVNIFKLKN